MQLKSIIIVVGLCLFAGAAHAQQACAQYNEPIFTAATGIASNHLARLPKDAPNPALITGAGIWSQANVPYVPATPTVSATQSNTFPLTMSGDVSIAFDPGGLYVATAGFPATQVALPHSMLTIGEMELRPFKPQFQAIHKIDPPFLVNRSDPILVAPEVLDSANTPVALIWTVCWQQATQRVNACGPATRLMINPEPTDGPTVPGSNLGYVTDASFSNHQITTTNLVISTALGFPSMLFDGLTSWASFVDGSVALNGPILDLLWGGDFTIEVGINTSDASADTQYREVFSGLAVSGTGASTAPVLYITPAGHIVFGNASGAIAVTSTSSVADGSTHWLAVSRVSGIDYLLIDGVLQATAADSTVYAPTVITFGRFPPSLSGAGTGRWHGHIMNFRATAGKGLYQTNYTVPAWPTC